MLPDRPSPTETRHSHADDEGRALPSHDLTSASDGVQPDGATEDATGDRDESTKPHSILSSMKGSGGLVASHAGCPFPSQGYTEPLPDDVSISIPKYPMNHGLLDGPGSHTTSWMGRRRLCQWGLIVAALLLLLWLQRSPAAFDMVVSILMRTYVIVRAAVAWLLWNSAPPFTAPPPLFPASGRVLWYRTPASSWSKEYLPIGNGFLAATVPGGTVYDETVLNIEDLWTGGPFENSSFNGGNPRDARTDSRAGDMQSIREGVFNSTDGTIPGSEFDVITTPVENYGSYTSAGRLAVTLSGKVTSGNTTNYTRWLDIEAGVARTQWTVGNTMLYRESFCSHPTRACIQLTNSSTPKALSLTYAMLPMLFNPSVKKFKKPLPSPPIPRVSCLDRTTMLYRGTAGNPGMDFEILARVQTSPANLAKCSASGSNATIAVHGATESWITWVGGTNFDQNAGNAAHSFSFKGPDPHHALVALIGPVTSQSTSYTSLLAQHTADVAKGLSTGNSFQLDLGQTVNLQQPTDELVAAYTTAKGDPYLEWLVFEYGRYMLFSSARGVLPANLQGKWARDSANPWGADYHSNINIQMNYWAAEPTNLDVTASLWDYLEKNNAPRGAETAQLLYNISRGWVMHNEMDIFGYTGMKGVGGTAQWANYPESAVWFMIHVWDHFDYTNDVAWWKAQGWPLLKGVASFHLDKLLVDKRFKDGTLVVAPCNSPEQPPITFGCAHAQQLIWQMFNAVEKGFAASGDTDIAFLHEVQSKREQMDKGLHIGSWGQLQEWKVDMDSQTDTHRHLSHLVGLYPGYAVSNFVGQTNSTKEQILRAAEVSLIARGDGVGPDADAGWEKVWRAACWAQLGNSSMFYDELKFALRRNFGHNLFSLYDPGTTDPIFQIDGNLGFPGAVINALVQALDAPSTSSPLTIVILPALPSAWGTGSVRGLRVRGGFTVNLEWTKGTLTSGSVVAGKAAPARRVEVVYKGKKVAMFAAQGGATTRLSV